MTEERMKCYFRDGIGKTWEEFKTNIIVATDNYEQCLCKLLNVFNNYNHHDDEPWKYFKEVYSDIPRVWQIPLMLETIYQSYNFNLFEMCGTIEEYLQSETDDERKFRINRNKELLKSYAKENKIVLYRGIAENSLLPENAISYSLDREVAESFLKIHNAKHDSKFGFIYEMEVPLDDECILYFSNEREEQEVFYLSEGVLDISAAMFMGVGDDLYLTEDKLQDYEDEYDIIRFPTRKSSGE